MNRFLLTFVVGALTQSLITIAGAVILPPTDDTSGTLTYNTAKPPVVTKRSLTSLNGTGTTLPVSRTRTAFVRFAVEETGMTAGLVEKARLTLYFPSVTKVGDLNLHVVTQDWEETFAGPTRMHPTFGASFLTIPWASVIKKQFVIVDVTQQVKDWLTTPGSNFGIAVTSPDGIVNVTIGSKEGSASGYPPLLEIEGTGATAVNTPNAIVKRDGDGNFMVGTITGALVGNATSSTTAGSATTFTGALAGDVTGTQDATAIASPTVTGKFLTGFATTAGSISATDTLLTAINKLDGNLALRAPLASPSFTGTVLLPAGTASAASLRLQSGTNLTSPAFGAVEFDGTNLFLTTNDASPTRKTIAFTDSAITSGQIPDAAITAPKLATGAVGSSQLASDLTLGGLTTGTFTGTLNGAATTAGSFTGSLSGDVTGTQGSTTVATINGISAANIAAGASLANAATDANTPSTIVKRDANGAFSAGSISASGVFNLPTTSSSNVGVITQNSSRLIHTFGTNNFFAGANAGNFSMTGSNNTGIGFRALFGNTSGGQNLASGLFALTLNTAGDDNVALGYKALEASTVASRNVAVGKQALRAQSFANGGVEWSTNNVAVGYQALFTNQPTSTTTGINNTAIGTFALGANTSGTNNIAIGNNAGSLLTTGSNNIEIGHPGIAGESNVIRIGDGVTQTDTFLTGVVHGDGAGLTGVAANTVGGVTAANVAAGATLANAATTASTPNTLVKRDANGNILGVALAATPPPGMVLIPAGAFTMGSTSGDTVSDAVPTVTTVASFYMDVNEVTLSQWQSVYYWAKDNGYTDLPAGSGKGPNHPVYTMIWYDVVKWCNARSEQAGKTPVYYTDDAQTTVYKTGQVNVTNAQAKWTANGYRLPTEAEWEKAARGGRSGQRFPWGNDITQNLANYSSTAGFGFYAYDLGPNGLNATGSVGGTSPATSPVGSFAQNGYGLNDMAGNVFEWCWDWYGTPYAGGTDPQGAASGSLRVLRGGSWGNNADDARCSARGYDNPGTAFFLYGLRAVLPPSQP